MFHLPLINLLGTFVQLSPETCSQRVLLNNYALINCFGGFDVRFSVPPSVSSPVTCLPSLPPSNLTACVSPLGSFSNYLPLASNSFAYSRSIPTLLSTTPITPTHIPAPSPTLISSPLPSPITTLPNPTPLRSPSPIPLNPISSPFFIQISGLLLDAIIEGDVIFQNVIIRPPLSAVEIRGSLLLSGTLQVDLHQISLAEVGDHDIGSCLQYNWQFC